jgi:hypothetical protein
MTMFRIIVTVLLAASLAAGCAPRAVDVGAPDADCTDDDCTDGCEDAGCDEETDGDGECPEPIAESCPNAVDPIPLLFEAAELGEGTRFLDVARWSVLAERDAGGTRTISIISCPVSEDGWPTETCGASTAVIASTDVPADTGPHAIALAGSTGYTGTEALWPYLAVLCDGAGCALYGAQLDADPPDAALAPIAGGELPATSAVHGLWRDMEGYLVCAYGDGIHCFDGSAWSSPQQANAEYPLFNDMEIAYFDGSPGAVAVGDLGRIALSGFPNWDGWWGEAYADWYTVLPHDSFSGGYVVAGEGGIADFGGGECAWADEDIVALLDLRESGMEWTDFATGGVFLNDQGVTGMTGACFTGQVVGEHPRAVAFPCGIETNAFIMDEGALYGTTDCAVD